MKDKQTDTYEQFIIARLKEMSSIELHNQSYRATGRTTRLCDELVQKFFEAPYGEWVPVIDHYGTRRADEELLDRFMKRMDWEFPAIEVECDKLGGVIKVRRKKRTYHELVNEALKEVGPEK